MRPSSFDSNHFGLFSNEDAYATFLPEAYLDIGSAN